MAAKTKKRIDPFSPEGIQAMLAADELERKQRDKHVVRRCPVCGRIPEVPPGKGGRHIYTLYCEKCQCRFVIHVNG